MLLPPSGHHPERCGTRLFCLSLVPPADCCRTSQPSACAATRPSSQTTAIPTSLPAAHSTRFVLEASVQNPEACTSPGVALRPCRTALYGCAEQLKRRMLPAPCCSVAQAEGGSTAVVWLGRMQFPALGISAQDWFFFVCVYAVFFNLQGSRGSGFLLKYHTNNPLTDGSKQTCSCPPVRGSCVLPPPSYFCKSVAHHPSPYSPSTQGSKIKRILPPSWVCQAPLTHGTW